MASTPRRIRNSRSSKLPLIKRPSPAAFDKMCDRRIPRQYLYAGLKMHKNVYQQTLKLVQDLAIRHLDFSIPHWNQPQDSLDFFKREVLLDPDLVHMTRYEDGWAVDIILCVIFYKRTVLDGLRPLLFEEMQVQDDCRPRQTPMIIRADSPVFKENQPIQDQDLDVHVDTVDSEAVPATSSRLALLLSLLGSVTPSLSRFYPVITNAGLSTDEHLHHFLSLTAESREKFIRGALADKATFFEQIAVIEVLEQFKNC